MKDMKKETYETYETYETNLHTVSGNNYKLTDK